VDIDRQAIERRDFPISRRGYDPAAVDAHLRSVAERLQQLADEGAAASMASAAGTQVHGIVAAAEAAGAEIEHQAREEAARVREEAITASRAHVAEVGAAAARLLERVRSAEETFSALVEKVRGDAAALAGELDQLEQGMDELYDASTARRSGEPAAAEREGAETPPRRRHSRPASSETAPLAAAGSSAPAGPEDVDGARLIALNMALSGEPRAAADRYLAENFQLADRAKLIDEVYAAVDA
jgi:DivIVA domain-containing protein